MTTTKRRESSNNTAYSYIRFSSREQAKGDSFRRQSATPAAYCERNGLTLDTSLTLRDLGVSAFRGDNATRGALAGFLQAIETGKVRKGSTLIVESLDRLTRSEIEEGLELFMRIIRAGVRIVTLVPTEQVFEKGKLELTSLIIALVVLSRGHEESAVKSARLSAVWNAKRERIGKVKLTKQCPAWLELSSDRTEYKIKPQAAAVVRRIFQMSIAGHGQGTITRMLNGEGVPSISGTTWHRSYIDKLLSAKATIGQFQPHVGTGRNRKPIGEPIADYFPAVVDEQTFYRAQAAIQRRRKKSGRPAKECVNLFQGLMYDAQDGSSYVMVCRGPKSRRRLVSSAAMRGEQGASPYVSVSMAAFEGLFLRLVINIKPADLGEDTSNAKAAELEAAEAKLQELGDRVKAIKAKVAEAGDVDALLDLLVHTDNQRKMQEQQVERLRQEVAAVTSGSSLGKAKHITEQLAEAPADQKQELRQQLRQAIQGLVEGDVTRMEDASAR